MNKVINNWEKTILFLILVGIFATNYSPGTWLMGWDNLMPELNVWMNIKRSFFAVWQEYQGLGLVGGMGHATDLIRQIIILPFSLIFPASLVRYLWHFSMIAIGAFGVLNILKNVFKLKKTPALLGSLFYLLNFGTIQIFWPPFEPFINFWGFFPWLMLVFIRLLKKQSKKNWLIFLAVNILATPSFYLQTIFVVYFISLIAFWLSYKFLAKAKKISLKPIFSILLINSFWILPFVYFLATNLKSPTFAKINQITSEETFLRNQKRGTLKDFALLRGYYYDFPDGEAPLMQPWQQHFSTNWPLAIGYLLSAVVFIGLVYSLISPKKKKNPAIIGILVLFLVCSVALLSATPPFSWINYFFRRSSFINQMFRSPFTKFIVPASFSFSILFAIGISFIGKRLIKVNTAAVNLLNIFSFFLIISFSLPVFKGNFIYPKMRVNLPQEYLQSIEYFKNQPKTARIANLPQGGFWGWTFYRWGYRGSGFLWYGIEQPILDRAFDVWNLKNENYYQELSYALQNQDTSQLEAIFDKYSIEYAIFDDNVFFPGEKAYAKQALKTRELLEKSERLTKVKNYGKVDIYKFDKTTTPYLAESATQIALPNIKNHQAITDLSIKAPLENSIFKRCNTTLSGTISQEKINENGSEFIRLKSKNDDACLAWWFPKLDISQGWEIKVNYRNIKGYPPLVASFDGQNNYKFFYEKLEKNKQWKTAKLVIPPYSTAQKGVAFTFSNVSYNQFESVNDISSLAIAPFEFNYPPKNNAHQKTSLEQRSNIWIYKINPGCSLFKKQEADNFK